GGYQTLAIGHIARLGDLVGDHVPAGREKVREHDLRDRPKSGHRRPHGRADDRLLGDRRIADALRSKALEEADRRLEHPAGRADVFADEIHRLIAGHLLRNAGGDRLSVAQFRHAAPPSLQTWRSISSIRAGAPWRASSVAASTFCWARVSISLTSGSATPVARSRSR